MKLFSLSILFLSFQISAASKYFTVLPGEADFRASGINVEKVQGFITCEKPGLGSKHFWIKYFSPTDLSVVQQDSVYHVQIKLPKMSVKIPGDTTYGGCYSGIRFGVNGPLISLFGSFVQSNEAWRTLQTKLGDLEFVHDRFYSNLDGLTLAPYFNSSDLLCVDRVIEFGHPIRCPE